MYFFFFLKIRDIPVYEKEYIWKESQESKSQNDAEEGYFVLSSETL